MIRLPLAIVQEAKRLAVRSDLRLYVVGSFAAYAAGAQPADRPADLDVIVVGPEEEYKDWERAQIEEDEEEWGGEVRFSRTRFGGLRRTYAVPAEGGVKQYDAWHHPTLADYLNRQDKGLGVVIDPVTGKIWQARPDVSETVYVYYEGKSLASVSAPARATIDDVLPLVYAALDSVSAKIPKGEIELDLRTCPGLLRDTLHHPIVYDGGKLEPSPHAPPAPPPPAKTLYGARWYSGAPKGHVGYWVTDTTTQVKFESSETGTKLVDAAVAALLAAGYEPTDGPNLYVRPIGPDGTRMRQTQPGDPGARHAAEALARLRAGNVQFLAGTLHALEFGKGLVPFTLPRADADDAQKVVAAAAEALRAAKIGLILNGTRIGIKTARVEDKSQVVGLSGSVFTV